MMLRQKMIAAFALSCCIAASQAAIPAKEANNPEVYWLPRVRLEMISHKPGDIETYRKHTVGNLFAGSAVGLGCGSLDGRRISATYKLRQKEQKLLLTVLIGDEDEESDRRDLDLSDLKPITIDFGTAKDGTQHFASIVPWIEKINTKRKEFSPEALSLDMWQFENTPVLVNDSTYVGRLGGSGKFADLDISDIASLSFSLKKTEGWKPWGTLHKGLLTLANPDEDTTIEVTGVKNGTGISSLVLPGGPYQVWVDWRPPAVTSEQAHAMLKNIHKQIVDGEIMANDYGLKMMEKQLARKPGPWIYSSGFSDRPMVSGP